MDQERAGRTAPTGHGPAGRVTGSVFHQVSGHEGDPGPEEPVRCGHVDPQDPHDLGDPACDSALVQVEVSPARAEDLSSLPPAHGASTEFDPLRDDQIEYALSAGVSVEGVAAGAR